MNQPDAPANNDQRHQEYYYADGNFLCYNNKIC